MVQKTLIRETALSTKELQTPQELPLAEGTYFQRLHTFFLLVRRTAIIRDSTTRRGVHTRKKTRRIPRRQTKGLVLQKCVL